ncbi:MAG TPA: ABC transporter ATP-binding protein [Chitinophagaceae bacterium]|nr:ABC transporter ATP-binding protein [Chitinophagaceae bacterium]
MKNIITNIFAVVTPKERKRLILFIIINAAVNLADILSVVCLLFVVKFYTQPYGFITSNPYLIKFLPSTGSIFPVVFLAGLFTLKNAGGYFTNKKQATFINNVAVRISKQNLAAYLRGPYSNYANADSSVHVSKIVYQPTEFAQFVLQGIQQVITECILVIFSTIALFIYNANLFAVVCLTLLPAIVILSWLNKKKLNVIKKNIQLAAEQSYQHLNEALTGYVESNIYDRNEFFINRHTASQQKLGGYITGLKITQDIPARFFEVFAVIGLLVLIVAIKFGNSGGGADVVMIGAFMAAAYKIIPGISKIITQAGFVKTYLHTIEAARAVTIAAPQVLNSGSVKIMTIQCRDIDFGYNGLEVFKGFDCYLHTGSFTGISGASGSGKTTLLQLLLGFYTPHAGAVLFNGKITGEHERMACWSSIAYVKQQPFILHDSILNNIILFEEHYDKKRLEEILEVTGVNEIAGHYREGIHKNIMEAGRNISGGQRQRIALARALYKNAGVILLDEPFSELDEISELKMLQYLQQLALSGKIVVLISHTPASFRLCDNVITL